MRKHHNKLFYGKYRYKNVFDMPWAGILYPTTDDNLQQMIDRTHRDILHVNKNFWKIDNKVIRLAKFIKENRNKMQFRIQQKKVIFYSDKGIASKLLNNFWTYWIGHATVEPKAKKLLKNTVVCKRLPHGKFKYQIYLKNDSHKIISTKDKSTLWNFLQRNKDDYLVSSRHLIGFLAGESQHCYGGYFYAKEQKMITPVYMMAQKIIEKVITFKTI